MSQHPPSSYPSLLGAVEDSFNSRAKVSNVIRGWNHKFTGRGDKTNVVDFLDRLNVLATADTVPERDLHRCAMHLFKDEALSWYMAYGRYCEDWGSLVNTLIDTYLRPDYYFTLEAQIRARRQRIGESVVQFISELELMYLKLDRFVTEREKMMNLRQNLSPVYRRLLLNSNFATMSELVEACLNIEQWLEQERTNRRPSGPRGDDVGEMYGEGDIQVDEDLCAMSYRRPLRHSIGIQVNQDVSKTSTDDVILDPNFRKSMRSQDRPQLGYIHCYKCGLPDYTTRDCPQCRVKFPSSKEPSKN